MKKLFPLKKSECLLIILSILISVSFVVFSLKDIKKDRITTIKTTLLTINKSCNEALIQWLNFRKDNIHKLSDNEYFISKTVELLRQKQDSATLVSSPITAELRKFFQPILDVNEDLGVFLIAPNYISIFSMRDVNTGSLNLMAKESKKLLDKVLFEGETVLIPPIESDVTLKSKYNNGTRNTMFIVSPIIYQNKIVAAFSLRIDINKDFSRILEIGKIGETGETHGIDKTGKIITTSRFECQLKENGNLDFTGCNGKNLYEITDCRGQQIFYVSVWNKKLNIGVVSQIDKRDALKGYFFVQKILIITFSLILIIGVIAVIIIISLRQKATNILTETNERLEFEVAQRTKELQQSIKIKDKFFSVIAHDLRSPFAGLLGLVDLLLHDPEIISEDEKNNMMSQIYNSGTRLLKLLENLLNWSRSQTHSIKLNPEKISMSELINENIILQKHYAQNKKIELINEIKQDISVLADRNTIDTVFRNLISNAIKFTKEGGSIKIKATVIDKKEVEIIVQDNGIGIPEENLHKLFRVDEKITTQGTNNENGTGLGLILCKEFVELNKGKISVKSTVGVGSSFIVSLKRI